MPISHHGNAPYQDLMREFFGPQFIARPRTYSRGRISPDDGGDFAYAIAADVRRGVIRIEFPTETRWIALRQEDAETMIGALTEKILELKGINKET